MNQQYSQSHAQTINQGLIASEQGLRVLRNTYVLLSMTLLFSAFMAYLSASLNWPHPGILITLVGYFGLLFLTQALRNSAWGILSVFALTGFMGMTLGPIVSSYLSFFSNGHQLVMLALGGTGTIFLAMSGIALLSKRDFSFLGKFLFIGLLVAFIAGLAAVFLKITALSLAASSMFMLLSAGLILYQTQAIVRGGETNYIMATVTLFVSLYNIFLSLLQLLGLFGEE